MTLFATLWALPPPIPDAPPLHDPNATYVTARLHLSTGRDPNPDPAGRFTPNDLFGISAFDCSVPKNVHPVQAKKGTAPCNTTRKAESMETTTFMVLQEARFTQLVGRRCTLTESQIPPYCGNYDHQTIALPMIKISEPAALSVDECTRLWRDGQYTSKKGELHVINRNGTTSIFFEPVGKTYVKDEIECVGGTAHWKGVKLSDMVVGVYRRYNLDSVKLQAAPSGSITDISHGLTLPCHTDAVGHLLVEQADPR